ncbi:hypothetical protein BD779DRAFT_1395717, partial [Infundibulicybe gibba]
IGADQCSLIVSNLVDGIDTYAIPPHQLVWSFRQPIHHNVPLLVSSALEGSLTVVGGDDGSVRLYDQRLGILSSILHHGKGALSPLVPSF